MQEVQVQVREHTPCVPPIVYPLCTHYACIGTLRVPHPYCTTCTHFTLRKECNLGPVPVSLAYPLHLTEGFTWGYLVQLQVLEAQGTIRVLGVLVPLKYLLIREIVTRGTRRVRGVRGSIRVGKKMYNGYKRYNKGVQPYNLPLLYLLYMREISKKRGVHYSLVKNVWEYIIHYAL